MRPSHASLRSATRLVLLLATPGALTACTAGPQPDATPAEDTAAAATATAEDGSTMAEHLGRQVTILRDKVVALAREMPADRYDWRPMEGVRSVAEVYAHIAADNYFVPALLGVPLPEGSDVSTDPATVGAHEKAMSTRPPADIIADLEASFALMDQALARVRTDPGAAVDLRGNALTAGDLWVRAVTHLHEHLGQSIAYARANRVVPPWSR